MTFEKASFRLELQSGVFVNENEETYIGYGFTAYSPPPERILFAVDDLSVDKNEVLELMRLIVDNDVSLAHFEDMIDDFCV